MTAVYLVFLRNCNKFLSEYMLSKSIFKIIQGRGNLTLMDFYCCWVAKLVETLRLKTGISGFDF
jgi:hypothetical protein